MKIGTPKEVFEGEARVAMTPDSARQSVTMHSKSVRLAVRTLIAPALSPFMVVRISVTWPPVIESARS